jgi:NCS1 family nucleobase:cation symporter-1
LLKLRRAQDLTTDLTAEEHEAWRAGAVEQRGIQHIPDDERRLTTRGLAGLWAGTQWNVAYIVFGLIVASFGLSLWQTIVVILVGNLSYILTGLASLQGPEAGTTSFAVSRAPFGQNANRIVGFFNWLTMVGYEVLNIYLAVAIAASLFALGDVTGLSFGVQLLLVVAAAVIQLLVPLMGHATITKIMSWIVWPFVVLFAIMAVLVLKHISFPTHNGSFGTWTLALAVIISAGGIGWAIEGNDFSRYLPRGTSQRSTVAAVLLGAGLPTVLLELLGACAFYTSGKVFDVIGVSDSFSDWFRIPFLILAMIQVWCTGALVVYSSGVTIQAIGIPLKRWAATALDGIIGIALALFVVTSGSFYSKLAGFVLYAIVWAVPWTAILLTDWILRRGRYDSHDLLLERGGRYWRKGGIHWPAIIAQALGMGAALLWLDASTAYPAFTGPLSSSFGGSDLSWLTGFVVAAVVYLVLAGPSVRREGRAATADSIPDDAVSAAATA